MRKFFIAFISLALSILFSYPSYADNLTSPGVKVGQFLSICGIEKTDYAQSFCDGYLTAFASSISSYAITFSNLPNEYSLPKGTVESHACVFKNIVDLSTSGTFYNVMPDIIKQAALDDPSLMNQELYNAIRHILNDRWKCWPSQF